MLNTYISYGKKQLEMSKENVKSTHIYLDLDTLLKVSRYILSIFLSLLTSAPLDVSFLSNVNKTCTFVELNMINYIMIYLMLMGLSWYVKLISTTLLINFDILNFVFLFDFYSLVSKYSVSSKKFDHLSKAYRKKRLC